MSPGDGQSVHIDHYVSPEDIWYTYMGYDGRPVVKGFFDKASLFAVLGSGCHSLADFTITGKMISGGSFIGETSSGSSAYTICF